MKLRQRYADFLIRYAYSEAFFGTLEVPSNSDGSTLEGRRAVAEFLNNKNPNSNNRVWVSPRTSAFYITNKENYNEADCIVRHDRGIVDVKQENPQLTHEMHERLYNALEMHLKFPYSVRGFNAFSPTYRGEMRPVVAVILLNALAAFSLCMYSIYTGVRNPAAILNMPSSTSVLCNPALNAIGSLVAGYLADKLVLRPLIEKYTLYKINSILETAYTELDVANKFTAFR